MNAREFEYEGYLVFTPTLIRRRKTLLDVSQPDDKPPTLDDLDELPGFEKGTPDEPGEGIEWVDLRDYRVPVEVREINKGTETSLEFGKYKSEIFTPEEVYVDDEIREGHVRDVVSADIFATSQDYLLLRGRKSAVNQAINYIQAKRHGLLIEYVDISPRFLSELYKSPDQIIGHTPLKLKKIRSVQFEGESELSSIELSVGPYNADVRDQSNDIGNRYPTSLVAIFEFFDVDVFVELKNNRIHARTSKGDLSEHPPITRMVYSTELSKIIGRAALEHSMYNEE
ncbi:hypothetical protein [Salinigranum marinum]|uniref:hypothetical protein n=1 Tax=Salinigranum marinum TaxID=1515595 RepID=UPI00298A0100|nr:hypothetical protein [Salinigranum marinum]